MEKVIIGKIVGCHGVHGELKVQPLTDDPLRFNQLEQVFIEQRQTMTVYDIEGIRIHKNMILLKLLGVDDRNAAEKLVKSNCIIDKKDRMPLPEGRFYIDDLIGLTVYENDLILGTLTDVLQPGANDVYVVKAANEDIIYVPALKAVVKSVDLENKRMDVVLPSGLR